MDSASHLWSFFDNARKPAEAREETAWETEAGLLSGLYNSGLPYIDDLAIADLLGEGTSFSVYACERTGRSSKAMAIKRPKRTREAIEANIAKTILRDIQIMAYEPLREHPNIAQMSGYIWPAFEKVPSLLVESAFYATLDKFLETEERFTSKTWDLCRRFCLDIARALASLHSEGIIHGDVKPQNILVVLPGGPDDPEAVIRARLTDFSHSSFALDMEHRTSYFGTPLYGAPEVLSWFYDDRESHEVTRDQWAKCDVWSYGLTAWCILTCRANYFNDEWLPQKLRDPPQRIPFLLSQSLDFLAKKACVAAEDLSLDMPQRLRDTFLEIFNGCLKGDKDQRYLMRDVSKLLDFNRDYEHPKATFGPTAADPGKSMFLSIELENLVQEYCPWSTKQSMYKGIAASDTNAEAAQFPMPRCFEKSTIANYHYITDIIGFPSNLASCFAYGYGVERNFESMVNTMSHHNVSPFTRKQYSRLRGALKSRLRTVDVAKEDSNWFAMSVREYQRLANEQYIATIKAVQLHGRTACSRHILQNQLQKIPSQHFPLLQVEPTTREGGYIEPLLHFAVLTGDLPLANYLVQNGYDVNSVDEENRTALFEACSLGNVEMSMFLLDQGANPSIAHENRTIPLHLLAFFPDDAIAGMGVRLLGREIDLFARTVSGFAWRLPGHGIELSGTPLHFAISFRNATAVKTLLRLGADPSIQYRQYSSLDLAASLCLPEICQLLISHNAAASKHWYIGRSPLHWLGASPHASLCSKWIMHGSAYASSVACTVAMLLSHGSRIDEEDEYKRSFWPTYGINYSPLGNAASNPRTDDTVLRCLLDAYISSEKLVPVEVLFGGLHASRSNHLNCQAFDIIYHHPSTEWYRIPAHQIKRFDGQTILHEAAKKDAVAVLKTILNHQDISINTINDPGYTALHYACQHASDECVQLLMEHGADVEIPTRDPLIDTFQLRYTALGLLIKARRTEVAAQRILLGADLWLGNPKNCGPTILHLAVSVRAVERVLQSQEDIQYHAEHLLSLPQEESSLVDLVEHLPRTFIEGLRKNEMMLNAVSSRLGTALHVAVMSGSFQATECLLEIGADRDVKDEKGRTPRDCIEDFYRSTRTGAIIVSQVVQTYIQETFELLSV